MLCWTRDLRIAGHHRIGPAGPHGEVSLESCWRSQYLNSIWNLNVNQFTDGRVGSNGSDHLIASFDTQLSIVFEDPADHERQVLDTRVDGQQPEKELILKW